MTRHLRDALSGTSGRFADLKRTRGRERREGKEVASLDRPTKRLFRWSAAAAALTLVDAVATSAWITHGLAVEGNPIWKVIIERFGASAAMGLRGAVGILLVVLLAALAPPERALHFLRVVTAILAVVAVWHVVGFVMVAT